MGTMGSQYIRGTTDLKQIGIRNKSYIKYLTNKKQKKQRVYLNRVLRHLPVFYADLWGIYEWKGRVFNKIDHVSIMGEIGWMKVGRSGGKWVRRKGLNDTKEGDAVRTPLTMIK